MKTKRYQADGLEWRQMMDASLLELIGLAVLAITTIGGLALSRDRARRDF